MRILRVAQTLYPDVAGGGAYHVHAMSRDQAAMGHDVTVLTVRQEPDQPHVEEREGYTVVRYDAAASPLGNALSPGLARHLLKADDYDVIHAHSHLYASTNLAALRRWLGALTGTDATPLAITNHGLYSQTAPEWVFDGYLRTVGRWTFDCADVVFCYTDVDERRLRDLGVGTDVAVVPNGVDTERFRPDGPESDLLDADGPAVLFVGRLVDGKRPQDALAAMATVRGAYPDARLYCCGDGPLREDLERRASDALDGGVEFLGHVDYDEMPDVYRAADVLVLPSRAEGMPRTVLEARAAGTPVVTTDLDHLAAVEDDDVRTVPVEDVDGLATAIVATLDDAAAAGRERTARAGDDRRSAVSDGGQAGTESTAATAGTDVRADGADGHGGGAETRADGADGHGGGVETRTDGADADAADRVALDWGSTVRRTTSVLSQLTEQTDSNDERSI